MPFGIGPSSRRRPPPGAALSGGSTSRPRHSGRGDRWQNAVPNLKVWVEARCGWAKGDDVTNGSITGAVGKVVPASGYAWSQGPNPVKFATSVPAVTTETSTSTMTCPGWSSEVSSLAVSTLHSFARSNTSPGPSNSVIFFSLADRAAFVRRSLPGWQPVSNTLSEIIRRPRDIELRSKHRFLPPGGGCRLAGTRSVDGLERGSPAQMPPRSVYRCRAENTLHLSPPEKPQ